MALRVPSWGAETSGHGSCGSRASPLLGQPSAPIRQIAVAAEVWHRCDNAEPSTFWCGSPPRPRAPTPRGAPPHSPRPSPGPRYPPRRTRPPPLVAAAPLAAAPAPDTAADGRAPVPRAQPANDALAAASCRRSRASATPPPCLRRRPPTPPLTPTTHDWLEPSRSACANEFCRAAATAGCPPSSRRRVDDRSSTVPDHPPEGSRARWRAPGPTASWAQGPRCKKAGPRLWRRRDRDAPRGGRSPASPSVRHKSAQPVRCPREEGRRSRRRTSCDRCGACVPFASALHDAVCGRPSPVSRDPSHVV